MFKWFWTTFSLGAPNLTPIRCLQYWNWKNLSLVVSTSDTTERMISMKSAVSVFLADHSTGQSKLPGSLRMGTISRSDERDKRPSSGCNSFPKCLSLLLLSMVKIKLAMPAGFHNHSQMCYSILVLGSRCNIKSPLVSASLKWPTNLGIMGGSFTGVFS